MKGLFLLLIAFLPFALAAQQVVNIYPGKAPGSENADWKEAQTFSKAWKTNIVYNVSQPTLTVYKPDDGKSNGTAVIVCPGGAFYGLAIGIEGTDIAKWLNKRGVTVFILKYRLIHSVTDDPGQEANDALKDPQKITALFAKEIPLAVADGKQAIAYVRSHAAHFGVASHKIGIVGFSAGGTVTASTAFNYTADSRPDFVAPIYAYVIPGGFGKVANDAPPMFLAAASDDELKLIPGSLQLYKQWLEAGKQAELHVYAKGGHGFGMRKQNLPVDSWIERFDDWLQFNDYINK